MQAQVNVKMQARAQVQMQARAQDQMKMQTLMHTHERSIDDGDG